MTRSSAYADVAKIKTKRIRSLKRIGDGLGFLAETLWLRFSLREQAIGAARVLEKGVLCWLHGNRGLLLAKPIRMFGERC